MKLIRSRRMQQWRRMCRLRHARTLRISILLLQLLCLPTCIPGVSPNITEGEEVNPWLEHIELSDTSLENNHNLRHRKAMQSSLTIATSFVNAMYALLGIAGSYGDEVIPITNDDTEIEAGDASLLSQSVGTPDDIRDGTPEDLSQSHESAREGRRLGKQRNNGKSVELFWYVDWINAECVQSCDPRTTTNPNCAGLAVRENFLFPSAKQCCKTMIPWKTYDTCTRVGSPDSTLNQVYEDKITPVINWGNVMVKPPVNNVQTVSGSKVPPPNKPLSTAQTFSQGKPPKSEPVSKDQVPQKGQLVPKASCWRSGTSCATEAQKFACCGICSNGLCI